MKVFFTISLILFSTLSFGQSPYSFTDTNKTWHTLQIGYGAWIVHICDGTKTQIFQGELINGQYTYQCAMESEDSLLLEWDPAGAYREDTLTKRVYRLYDDTLEYLVYDFDMEIGDTSYSPFSNNPYYQEHYIVCTNKDSVLVEGVMRYRFSIKHYFEFDHGYIDQYLEGIGSLSGPFYGGENAPGTGYKLLCCSYEGSLIYNSDWDTCHLDEFYPKIVNTYFDTAYLNTNYKMQLEMFGANYVDSCKWVAGSIPDGFSFDQTTGLLIGHPSSTGNFGCVILVENCDFNCFTDIICSEIQVVLSNNTENTVPKPDIKIYPNPFSTDLGIDVGLQKPETLNLEIFNATGNLIERRKLQSGFSNIDCSSFENGIYLFKITDMENEIVKIEKVLKGN
jgi:Secretion system C-terminal sorting domain